jgi:hypothetical protein
VKLARCQEVVDADALICRNNEMRISACVDSNFTIELAKTSFQHTIPAADVICRTLEKKRPRFFRHRLETTMFSHIRKRHRVDSQLVQNSKTRNPKSNYFQGKTLHYMLIEKSFTS